MMEGVSPAQTVTETDGWWWWPATLSDTLWPRSWLLRQIITFVSCGHKNVEIPTPRDTLNTNWVWPLVCTAISLAGDGIQGSEYQSGFVNNNDYHWAAQLSHYYHPAPRQYNHAQIFSPWDRNDSMVTGLYTKLEEQWWERCGERGSRVNKQAPRSPFIVVNWYPPDSVYF